MRATSCQEVNILAAAAIIISHFVSFFSSWVRTVDMWLDHLRWMFISGLKQAFNLHVADANTGEAWKKDIFMIPSSVEKNVLCDLSNFTIRLVKLICAFVRWLMEEERGNSDFCYINLFLVFELISNLVKDHLISLLLFFNETMWEVWRGNMSLVELLRSQRHQKQGPHVEIIFQLPIYWEVRA